jgi:glyoxylase-like metal-dependent hydrolase (beta-lactamase superfamily II)
MSTRARAGAGRVGGPAVDAVPGVTRVALPIEVNAIESVNMYIVDDGDKVTVVDCGVWQPDKPDGGVATVQAGLRSAGYELTDVSRLVITHAHIDHYGLAGRVMELTGADLAMHAMTDLDCQKYRHPETSMSQLRDTYADHGVAGLTGDGGEPLGRWMPFLHSVVEASTRLRGDETIGIGADDWSVIHTPGHSLGHICLWSPRRRLLLSGDHLLPGITPPVTFERGFDIDPMLSYLRSLQLVHDLNPELVYPGHGRPFGDVIGRIEAIMRNKMRRMARIRRAIQDRPSTVGELTEKLVAGAMLPQQRQMAINETLAHIACLRYARMVERRTRPDGVYEWFSTSDDPLDAARLLASPGS